MKKRLILLGLGLAVVGTGMVINKLRKRNNEEEVNEVEETIETEEVEEMVEMVRETEENNEEVKEENVTEELAIDIDMKKFDLNKILNFVETHKEKILKGTLSVALACLFVKYGRALVWVGCFAALVVAIYGTLDGFLKGIVKEEN
jgi:hypothetical protein